MPRLSNCLFIALNCLSFALGVASLSCSAYIQFHGVTACQKAVEIPLLLTGLFLLVLSLLGLVGSCCRHNLLLWIYLFLMFILIVGLVAFTVFVLIVTNKSLGKKASPNRLQDYSFWLQRRFGDGRRWEEIKSCLNDVQVCKNLEDVKIEEWSLIQSGCCKPPIYCGFSGKNATFWIMPEKGPAATDKDCTTFSNNQQQLCYDCKSCKRAVVANIKQQWRLLAILNSCVTVLVAVVFSLGCCVRKNNRCDPYIRYHAGYH